MTPEAVQPATATQTATSIELKSDRVTVTFDPATGMISPYHIRRNRSSIQRRLWQWA